MSLFIEFVVLGAYACMHACVCLNSVEFLIRKCHEIVLITL